MTSRASLGLSLGLVVSFSFVVACGGSVALPGNGGGGATSGSGGATSVTGSGGATSVTGSATSGTGASTTTSTGTGGASACEAITSEVGCLGAFPQCVPVYDDKCCPSCEPTGGCADCVDIHFHHCAPAGVGCIKAPCAAPAWACAGTEASCAIEPGSSNTPCHAAAGCTAGYCNLNTTCKTDPICVPVTKGSCTAACDAIPPPCAAGTVAESDGFCYTGLCIPAEVCAL